MLPKKKVGKWPYLDQNDGLTSLEKCQFILFQLFVFIAYKVVFFVLEYRRRHFPGLYYLKEKVGKMAIFGPKPWVGNNVNRLGNNVNLSTF